MEPHPSTLICASHFMLAAGQIYSQHCRTLHDKTSMSRVVNNCKEQSQIVRSRVKFLYTASAVLFDANSLEFRNSSRTSNIAFLLELAQMLDLDFGLIQQSISIKKASFQYQGRPLSFKSGKL